MRSRCILRDPRRVVQSSFPCRTTPLPHSSCVSSERVRRCRHWPLAEAHPVTSPPTSKSFTRIAAPRPRAARCDKETACSLLALSPMRRSFNAPCPQQALNGWSSASSCSISSAYATPTNTAGAARSFPQPIVTREIFEHDGHALGMHRWLQSRGETLASISPDADCQPHTEMDASLLAPSYEYDIREAENGYHMV